MNSQLLTRRPPGKFRPRVENLEDRLVPAVSVQQAAGSNLIVITATGRQDAIRIVDNGGNGAGAISVQGTGLHGTFHSAAAPAGTSLALAIAARRATTRVSFFAHGHASTGKRDVAVALGSPKGPSHLVRGRTIVTASGEVIEIVVSRNFPAGAFSFTVFDGVTRPVAFTSGFFPVPVVATTVVPILTFPVLSPAFGGFFFNPVLEKEFAGFPFLTNPFLNPVFPNEFAGFPTLAPPGFANSFLFTGFPFVFTGFPFI
jgi:hypothetical protein